MSELNHALSYSQVAPATQRYRSELEHAIIPTSAHSSPVQQSLPPPHPSLATIPTVEQLVQQAQASEQAPQRRLAWEHPAHTRYRESPNRIDPSSSEPAFFLSTARATPVPPASNGLVFAHYRPNEPPVIDGAPSPESSLDPSQEDPPSRKRPRSISFDGSELIASPNSIHQAVRHHILESMALDSDTDLPPSHTEGVFLDPSDPVRFIWEKTTRQSVHNTRMKSRIIERVKANQIKYPHLLPKDFNARMLDSVFEQQYKNLRQKFAAQSSAQAALKLKKRTDYKAKKARHSSRRKNKLKIRTNARMRFSQFEHPLYDGAFNVECMSSEESDFDEVSTSSGSPSAPSEQQMDPSSDANPQPIIRVRGHAWRSARLIRLFAILDDSEETEKTHPSRTGPKSRVRVPGPVKDGFYLPPSGVAKWMISRRWVRDHSSHDPNIESRIEPLIDPNESADMMVPGLEFLGDESGSESGNEANHSLQPHQHNYYGQHQGPPSSATHSYINHYDPVYSF